MAQAESEDFNTIQFEKRLTSLKDSQDHINGCCKWCLENRHQHKKIVSSWLNVFKRVKIEQRLILFYLANDVIQYSKRRNYDFVDTWATALQKATTLVRDDKVKHKIVRIFNIWEQRGVYNEEFISDLCGLISAVPTAAKNDEPHEFQAQYVINKIKHCAKLENDTDAAQKILKEHNPKIQVETETLCGSLKDRAHVDDVEKELENYLKHLENYVNALKSEIKARITNISVLKQANTQLDKDKKDVKVVATAYKTFGTRIRAFQKKLDEHKDTLVSPVPSPDIDAPSPSPDSDLDLPDDEFPQLPPLPNSEVPAYTPAQTYSANYYNPVPPPSTESNANFVTNGFTSFIGSNFGLEGLGVLSSGSPATPAGTSSHLAQAANSDLSSVLQSITAPPPPPDNPAITTASSNYQQYQQPLLPPPMPPFSTSEDYSASNYSKPNYASPYASTETATTYNSSIYQTPQVSSFDSNTFENPAGIVGNPYPHPVTTIPSATEEYNPEQDLETWDADVAWTQQQQPQDADTPESPPMFEKEGYNETAPIEYHDNSHHGLIDGASDVDHRVLNPLSPGIVAMVGASSPSYAKLLANRLIAGSNGLYPFQENGRSSGRGADVDHRNLISLTGSPADSNSSGLPAPAWPPQGDQDYRNKNPPTTPGIIDQDYRLAPPPFNLEHLKLPPPPPPPTKPAPPPLPPTNSKKHGGDDAQSNVIDMDLSEDEMEVGGGGNVSGRATMPRPRNSLRPPPPLPEFPIDPDDDANSFLDDLNNDLNSHEFTATLTDMSRNVVPPPPLPENKSQGVYNKVGMKAPPPLLMGIGYHQQQQHPPMPSMMEMQQQQQQQQQQNYNMQLGSGMQFGNMLMQNNMGMMYDVVPQEHNMMEMEEMDMDNNMYNEMNNWQGNNNNNNNKGANRSRPPFPFKGRGRGGNGGGNNFRGGRGRGGGGFRGGPNNFRGRGFNRGGGGRPPRSRGNRGNFQGGF